MRGCCFYVCQGYLFGITTVGLILSVFQQISDQARDDGRIKLMLRVTFSIKFRCVVFILSNIQAGDDGCFKVEITVVLKCKKYLSLKSK